MNVAEQLCGMQELEHQYQEAGNVSEHPPDVRLHSTKCLCGEHMRWDCFQQSP